MEERLPPTGWERYPVGSEISILNHSRRNGPCPSSTGTVTSSAPNGKPEEAKCKMCNKLVTINWGLVYIDMRNSFS